MFIWTLFRELWCSKSFLCLVGHTAGNFSEITMFFLFFGTPFGKFWILPCLLGHPFGNFGHYHVYWDTLLENFGHYHVFWDTLWETLDITMFIGTPFWKLLSIPCLFGHPFRIFGYYHVFHVYWYIL